MNCADNILAYVVIDHAVQILFVQRIVSAPSICREQTDFVRDDFLNESRSVLAVSFSSTRVTTLPLWLTAPITGILSEPPRTCVRLSQCRLRSLIAMQVEGSWSVKPPCQKFASRNHPTSSISCHGSA